MTWKESNGFPSSPVFVPKDQSTSEDDGILAFHFFCSSLDATFFVALNAKNFKEICKIQLPQVIPLSFCRGLFLSDRAVPDSPVKVTFLKIDE